jgi:nifR3 family TIM-barrel protein
MKLKFGNLELKNNVLMAPLCGVTDLPFRRLAVEQGAGLVHTEMVSCAALVRDSHKTVRIMDLAEDEHPVGIQLFGCNPEEMAEAARMVEAHGADVIGINFGCPVPKVVKHNGGSALLKEPATIGKIVAAVVKASSKPVIPKIRTGWDAQSVNAEEVGKTIEDAGAHGLMIHGRTRAQKFSGYADWDVIAGVKAKLSIPVIGNGDLMKPEDSIRMMEKTGVDGVLLARGAMGNPWLISRTIGLLENGETPAEPDFDSRLATLQRHFSLMFEYKGTHGLAEMRKHAMWYLKGLPGSAEVRNRLNQSLDFNEIIGLLQDYRERLRLGLVVSAPEVSGVEPEMAAV